MLQTDKQTDATLRGWGVGAGNEQKRDRRFFVIHRRSQMNFSMFRILLNTSEVKNE